MWMRDGYGDTCASVGAWITIAVRWKYHDELAVENRMEQGRAGCVRALEQKSLSNFLVLPTTFLANIRQ